MRYRRKKRFFSVKEQRWAVWAGQLEFLLFSRMVIAAIGDSRKDRGTKRINLSGWCQETKSQKQCMVNNKKCWEEQTQVNGFKIKKEGKYYFVEIPFPRKSDLGHFFHSAFRGGLPSAYKKLDIQCSSSLTVKRLRQSMLVNNVFGRWLKRGFMDEKLVLDCASNPAVQSLRNETYIFLKYCQKVRGCCQEQYPAHQ